MFFENPQQKEFRKQTELLNRQQQGDIGLALLNSAAHPQAEMIQQQQREQREDLIRWQQDLTEEMQMLEHDLKNEVYDKEKDLWVPIKEYSLNENTGEWELVDAEPLCNDVCIQTIKSVVRPFMTKNEIMSNYSGDEIRVKLRSTMKTLIRNLGVKYDYYGIDYHNLSNIRKTVQNFIMSAPFRALNNGERRMMVSSTRRIENVNEGQQQQSRGGLFGWFN